MQLSPPGLFYTPLVSFSTVNVGNSQPFQPFWLPKPCMHPGLGEDTGVDADRPTQRKNGVQATRLLVLTLLWSSVVGQSISYEVGSNLIGWDVFFWGEVPNLKWLDLFENPPTHLCSCCVSIVYCLMLLLVVNYQPWFEDMIPKPWSLLLVKPYWKWDFSLVQ